MIHPIDIAEAEAQALASEADQFIVVNRGSPISFCTNFCGFWANPSKRENATRFDSIHEAGAVCRRAKLTGTIAIEPA